MARHGFVLFLVALSCFSELLNAISGYADPVYQSRFKYRGSYGAAVTVFTWYGLSSRGKKTNRKTLK